MRNERAFAECFAVNYAAAMADEQNAAGDFVVLNGGVDNGVQSRGWGERISVEWRDA